MVNPKDGNDNGQQGLNRSPDGDNKATRGSRTARDKDEGAGEAEPLNVGRGRIAAIV